MVSAFLQKTRCRFGLFVAQESLRNSSLSDLARMSAKIEGLAKTFPVIFVVYVSIDSSNP